MVLGAFAVLPVAVLSSQGLTMLLVLIGLGTLITGDWKGRQPITAVLLLLAAGVAWAALTSLWALAPKDALGLAGSLAVLFIVIVLLMDRAQSITAHQRTVIGTMLVAGFGLGVALLGLELIADLPLANLVRGPRPGQDLLELSLLNPSLTVLVLMAWPVGYTVWQRWSRAVIAVPVLVVGLVWLGTSVTAWIAMAAGVGRMVYTSSVATLGLNQDGTPAHEDTPVALDHMIGHYKRSKFLAEEAVQSLIRDHGAPVVIAGGDAFGWVEIRFVATRHAGETAPTFDDFCELPGDGDTPNVRVARLVVIADVWFMWGARAV